MKSHPLNKIEKLIAVLTLLSVAFVLNKGPESFKTVYVAPRAEALELAPVALENIFFGKETRTAEAQEIIDYQLGFVSSRKAYGASLAVVEKHQGTIKQKSNEHGVPEDVALGVALLENGGSEVAVSGAGATGIFQLMKGTAKNLGLKVDSEVDERKDPEKNIEAGVRYLAKNYERFGDWGLATWAYHAGEGNVAKALKIYAKNNDDKNLPGVENSPVLKSYVLENQITIHKLLSDPSVKKFTEKLNDDSRGYPYKVIATSKLFRKAESADKDRSNLEKRG